VVHRVICTWPRVRTRGDAVRMTDALENRDRIIGIVQAVWRDGRQQTVRRYPSSLWYVFARPFWIPIRIALGAVKRSALSVLRRQRRAS
jgi:hypothetical protein